MWAGLNATGEIAWHKGRLVYVRDLRPDFSAPDPIAALFGGDGFPAFFLDMATAIDLEIPPASEVMKLVEPHQLVQSMDSPALNLPSSPDPDDLAVCLVASRIAWECRDHLVVPAPLSRATFERALARVAMNAFALGGPEKMYTLAKAITARPDLWTKRPDLDDGATDFDGDYDDED